MSKIYVDEIAGIASANTVAIPGHVIQVVSYTLPTTFYTNSTTAVSTGLQASITPTSTSSKILVQVAINGSHKAGGSAVNEYSKYMLYSFESGQSAASLANLMPVGNISNGTNGGDILSGTVSADYLDTPNTTNQMNYVIYAKSTGTMIYFSELPAEGRYTSTITLMEIAG